MCLSPLFSLPFSVFVSLPLSLNQSLPLSLSLPLSFTCSLSFYLSLHSRLWNCLRCLFNYCIINSTHPLQLSLPICHFSPLSLSIPFSFFLPPLTFSGTRWPKATKTFHQLSLHVLCIFQTTVWGRQRHIKGEEGKRAVGAADTGCAAPLVSAACN